MASEALAQLIESLRATGPDFTNDPFAVRKEFEALLSTIPVATDVKCLEVNLAGVPAIFTTTPRAEETKALLYLHGGAYTVGSARGYLGLSSALAAGASIAGYSVDYRLAPEHPFPAAIEDAVKAYRGLLERGFTSDQVALAGDSAGGGLALATLVSLRDEGLPLPACATLFSPWTDLRCLAPAYESKRASDPSLKPEGLRTMARHYLGSTQASNDRASPVLADLSGLPPILIQVGAAEILLDDAVEAARAAGAQGTAVQLQIWPDMIHVWQAFHFMLPEGRAAVDAAAQFIKSHLVAAQAARRPL